MTLAELIASEAANATKTDSQVLEWLQELIAVREPINSRRLLRWGGADGRLTKLREAAASHASESIRSVADAALLTVTRPDTELDLADARHETLVDALIAGGVLTADDKTELVTMATGAAPRWQVAGVKAGEVTLNHVSEARNA